MARTYTTEFKHDAVVYTREHPEMTYLEIAEKLGIPYNTLYRWLRKDQKEIQPDAFDENGNLSDLKKENLMLQRKLRDAEDALEILKKAISILGD